MIKGIKVVMKDGTVEHYDPVPHITIDNTFYTYQFNTEDIATIEVYDITKEGEDD